MWAGEWGLRENRGVIVAEESVVEGLRDGCPGHDGLRVGHSVPDYAHGVPLLLFFDLHLFIINDSTGKELTECTELREDNQL